MFDRDFIFVPFGVSRIRITTGINQFIGYADYRIFGFRVARVQETCPWK